MAATMRELAAELSVPLLACLEGGYSLHALSASVIATLEALIDSAEPPGARAAPAAPHRDRLARYWQVLRS
jgi:acetoin utilization deacetylase AcuC-like enzyme